MPSATNSAEMRCTSAPLGSVDVEVLILPWFEGEPLTEFAALDRAASGEIARSLASTEFSGKPFELFITPVVDSTWKPRRIALIGAGRQDGFTAAVVRRLAAAAGLSGRAWRPATVVRSRPRSGPLETWPTTRDR